MNTKEYIQLKGELNTLYDHLSKAHNKLVGHVENLRNDLHALKLELASKQQKKSETISADELFYQMGNKMAKEVATKGKGIIKIQQKENSPGFDMDMSFLDEINSQWDVK